VDDMSAQPISPPDYDEMAKQSEWIATSRNPYADTPTEVLIDSLEAQYDRGEQFCPEMVFEALNRLIDAHKLGLPPSER
jgi:hypothetical protein